MEILEKTVSKNGHGKHSPMIEDFIPVNKIVNEDCDSGMKKLPDGCIDLVVPSPPVKPCTITREFLFTSTLIKVIL